ncbi:MAG: UbiA family prenyltransferase [Nitrospirae bacterium]|nr:UbiA family prenyltransferase [Nitrospirota bacterium]MBF0535041.1 UbiA family prenyltransferase [Nitrospirota bacterium]MBF0616549.1 UbiA family prenyltransferase [Nitrospirota bacterium]
MHFIKRTGLYLKMIKFSHSVFALPFAFTSGVLACAGIPTGRQILWITAAMVSARSAAMGLNRIADRKIDALNPRTKNREIPAGAVKLAEASVFTAMFSALFVLSAYMLNPLCFKLSPVVLAVLFFYSYTKRFTWSSHLFLGIAISGAPLGAWIAIRGEFSLSILPLVFAVVFWLAGFDILYALQDVDFDKTHGLYSIPQRFGVKRAITLSRVFHLLTFILLAVTGVFFKMGFVYFIGISVVAALLIYEHSLVKPNDLSKLDMAFFNINGYISVTVFVFVLLENTVFKR